jgi:hypothetical protein
MTLQFIYNDAKLCIACRGILFFSDTVEPHYNGPYYNGRRL